MSTLSLPTNACAINRIHPETVEQQSDNLFIESPAARWGEYPDDANINLFAFLP
ncbi:MAG TPA: hypothetical protein VGO47_00575 [Chlamydiales bacterium]|jgi:hypothetical protein|nr:hypothetical protein [Chlamydiales bacterium]